MFIEVNTTTMVMVEATYPTMVDEAVVMEVDVEGVMKMKMKK